ncbi:unnamed protein product, partial [marine sediment metagenome]
RQKIGAEGNEDSGYRHEAQDQGEGSPEDIAE